MRDWPHQAHEYQIGRDKEARALIWPMRSGKSKTCIDKACYQYSQGTIEGVIIIAPNGVHLNWINNEVPKHGWPTIGKHVGFAWESSKRGFPEQERRFDLMLHHGELKWFAINMDALKMLDCRRAVKRFIAACRRKFMLIVSEAHHFGRASAKRTYFARSLAHHAAYRQTETGTPILTGPLRAFSQYELLEAGALGFGNYTDFKNHFAEFGDERIRDRTYTKVKGYKNLDELSHAIARWSSVVLRDELRDMPALIRAERPIVMSDAQRKAYIQMVAHHLAEIGDEYVTVKDAGPRMMKLQQILHGYIRDTEAERILEIEPEAPIYNACLEQIMGTLPGKSLVWCRYKEDIRRVAHKLGQAKLSWLEYSGRIPDMDLREQNRKRFLTDDSISVMLGTPDAGGEGLDFSAADAVIFFSVPPNARLAAQAEERATVQGGKPIAVVRMRHYGTVDDRIWQIIDGNVSLSDAVCGHGLRDLLRATDV